VAVGTPSGGSGSLASPSRAPLRNPWNLALLGLILALGGGLRLAVLDDYESGVDFTIRLNWARRLVVANELGPLSEVASLAVHGRARELIDLLPRHPDSLLFAVGSGTYPFPNEGFRLGSVALMAGWLRATGYGFENARLFSAAIDLLGVALVGLLAIAFTRSALAGLAAAALLALLPAKALFSFQAFYHVFAGAGAAACLLAFARCLPRREGEEPARPAAFAAVGLAFGALMYVNWLLPQLALLIAGVHAAAVGWRTRVLRAVLLRGALCAAVAVAVVSPMAVYCLIHLLFLGWDVTSGSALSNEAKVRAAGSLGGNLSSYLANATEYYTWPVGVAALLGCAAMLREPRLRASGCAMGLWLSLHLLFFGILTPLGGWHLRVFQLLEIPVAICAGAGLGLLAESLVHGGRAGRVPAARWGLVSAAVAVLLAAPVAQAGRLLQGSGSAESALPGFHATHDRGRPLVALCDAIAREVPAGANVWLDAWQTAEAVCWEGGTRRFVNLGSRGSGFCGRSGEARDRYLETFRVLPNAPGFVAVEVSRRRELLPQERCADEVVAYLDARGRTLVAEALSEDLSYRLFRVDP
jgi:hypothetical protein